MISYKKNWIKTEPDIHGIKKHIKTGIKSKNTRTKREKLQFLAKRTSSMKHLNKSIKYLVPGHGNPGSSEAT